MKSCSSFFLRGFSLSLPSLSRPRGPGKRGQTFSYARRVSNDGLAGCGTCIKIVSGKKILSLNYSKRSAASEFKLGILRGRFRCCVKIAKGFILDCRKKCTIKRRRRIERNDKEVSYFFGWKESQRGRETFFLRALSH